MNPLVRKVQKRFLVWRVLDFLALLAWMLGGGLVLSIGLFSLQAQNTWGRPLLLAWGIGFGMVLVWKFIATLWVFFNRKAILRLIEKTHPEYANRLSTLEYLQSQAAESRELGYSEQLIGALAEDSKHLAPPSWERLGLEPRQHRYTLTALGAGLVCLLVCFFLAPAEVGRVTRVWVFGETTAEETRPLALILPERVEVPIQQVVAIPAQTGHPTIELDWKLLPPGTRVEFLLREPGKNWKEQGFYRTAGPSASRESNEPESSLPSDPVRFEVKAPLELVAMVEGVHSNVCRIEPIYPPAVRGFTARLTPPAYSRQPSFSVEDRHRVEGLEGSRVELEWTANNDLRAATLEILSATRAPLDRVALLPLDPRAVRAERPLDREQRLLLTLEDRFGQTARIEETRLLPQPDQLPSIEILSPTRESVLPPDLQVPTQVLFSDDIGMARIEMVHRIATGIPGQGDMREVLADISAATGIVSATGLLLRPVLNLEAADLWPGDQVSYWFEATDWRGDQPGRVGRSETYVVRYPSVEENLEEMAAMRAESTTGLEEMLEDQKEINRQFKEIRQDIQRNLDDQSDPESKWKQEKKLAETLERQQQVEQQLSEVAESFEQSLQRLSEDNEITLRTLEKFERVQQLMDDLLSEDTKQMIREIQETLEKLQKDQLHPEEMENTEASLQEFEQQLDRQLELLENMWMEHEIEALSEQAQELADRQQELLEETLEKLLSEQEKEELEKEGDTTDTLADEMDGIENLLDKLVEEMKEKAAEGEQVALEQQSDASGESQSQSQNPQESGSQEPEEGQDQGASSEEKSDPQAESAPSEPQQSEGEKQESSDPAGSEDAQESPSQEQQQASSQGQQSESQPPQQSDSEPEPAKADPETLSPEEKAEFEKILAERQEQLARDTEKLLDDLKRLKERAQEENSKQADQLADLSENPETQSIPEDQKSASSNLQRNQPKQAGKKQSSASKKMQEMAGALSSCCSGSDKDLEDSLAKMREILERAFILSEESEGNDRELARFKALASWPNVDRMSRLGQQMGWYKQESVRLSETYRKVTEKNPFADFTVVRMFDRAARNWRENTRVMEESPPLVVSTRSHQSLAQVNLAIEKLLDSIQQTESQCQSGSSGGMEGYFRGLKKVLKQQQQINQESKSLNEQDEGQGQEPSANSKGSFSERMRKMAQQQEATRKMLQELEERYQNMTNRPGNLEGIGEQMEDVEKELEHGNLDDRVVDTQNKIEQRLLDAEKSMHTQGFEKKRRALRAEGEGLEPGATEEGPAIDTEEQQDLARLLRQNLDDVSPHWRNRVRTYYDRLLRMNP